MRSALMWMVASTLFVTLAACGGGETTVQDVETFEVRRGDLDLKLTETGATEARNKVDIRPLTKAVIETLVDQGTYVKKGDILAELEKKPTEDEIDKFEIQVTQLEAERQNAETDLSIQKGENASAIEGAILKFEFSELELKRYLEGDQPQQVRDRELRIDEARSRLKQAEDKYANIPALMEEGFVTSVEAEEKRLSVKSAKVELDSALLALELYNEYTHPMAERQKRADLTEAERELGRIKERAAAREQARSATLKQKDLNYRRAVERLAEARERLNNLTIIAPQDGIVIYGGRRNRWGGKEDTIQVGSTAHPGSTLIELPDLSKIDVAIRVHQADIDKLRPGQKAWVSLPSNSSQRFEGQVSEIGSVAESGSWRDRVRRFDVNVQIVESVKNLRAGVTVEVDIELGNLSNVLYVPLQSVSPSGGGFHVFVKEGDEVKKRRVRLGGANDQFVEVTGGLEEGDRVLLVNPDIVSEEEEEDGEAGKPGGPGNGKRPQGRPSGKSGRPSGRPSGSR